jgi:hypothetical protein
VPAALLAGVLAFAALGGFDRAPAPTPSPSGSSSVVVVVGTPLTSQAATVCPELMAKVPPAGADPPIVLVCGEPQFAPPSAPSTDREEGYYILSNVCWYAVRVGDGTTWHTMDREVPLTVHVPAAYDPPGQRVIAFSEAILASVPTVASIPAGCR